MERAYRRRERKRGGADPRSRERYDRRRMRSSIRIAGLLLAALLLATAAVPARADQAYQRVAGAFGQAGGHLDPCAFTTAQLEAALRGMPPALRSTVPALRSAIEDAIAARKRGECKGVRAEEGTTGGAAAGTVPPVTTTPPAPAQPATPAPATAAPATTPAPAPTAPTQPAAASSGGVDRHTALVLALIGIGALMLAALGLWGTARSRGWDPAWVARTRHAWGEAGFRTTSTWAEFTDWLRLGR